MRSIRPLKIREVRRAKPVISKHPADQGVICRPPSPLRVARGLPTEIGIMNGIEAVTEADAMVFVVDDDVSMRASLENLVRSIGLRVKVFASAEEFLRSKRPDVPACLLLDVQLPGLSGLDLQSRMTEIAMEIPIIFMTGHGDIPTSVRAMKAGAVTFLIKPFGDQALIDAIQQGIERDRVTRRRLAKLTEANAALRGCLDALASVPELDDFLGQVLAAITRQLGAVSSTLRVRNFEQNTLSLELVFQEGRVMAPDEAKYPERWRSVSLEQFDPDFLCHSACKRTKDEQRVATFLDPPAAIIRVLDPHSPMPDDQRSYLRELGVKTVLIIPLASRGQANGRLTFRFTEERDFHPEELEIARALAIQASLAIQLIRLAKAARQSAVLEERNRLAGEIHDSLAQNFAGISLQLFAAEEDIKTKRSDGLNYLERANNIARFGLAEARRTALSLHPFILDKIGLSKSIQMLVERSNVPGRLRCSLLANDSLTDALPPETQQHLLRLAQEAISNAVRHANPTTISVSLRCDRDHLELQIRDNGCGISAAKLLRQNGFGLTNMQNRAKKIGASLDIRTGVGGGTAIAVRLPLNA